MLYRTHVKLYTAIKNKGIASNPANDPVRNKPIAAINANNITPKDTILDTFRMF